MLFKEKKNFFKTTTAFYFYSDTGKIFAFSKTSAMDGVGTLFEKNVYFIRIYNNNAIKLILRSEQLT